MMLARNPGQHQPWVTRVRTADPPLASLSLSPEPPRGVCGGVVALRHGEVSAEGRKSRQEGRCWQGAYSKQGYAFFSKQECPFCFVLKRLTTVRFRYLI